VAGVGVNAVVPEEADARGGQRDRGIEEHEAEVGRDFLDQLAGGGEEPVGVGDGVHGREEAGGHEGHTTSVAEAPELAADDAGTLRGAHYDVAGAEPAGEVDAALF
jgi:hypothetical protein